MIQENPSNWHTSSSRMRQAFAQGKLKGLRTHQRNIFSYYLAQKEKYPKEPCYLPRASCHHFAVFMNAIDVLEQRGLVSVIREGDDYRNWILSEPLDD